MPSVLRGAIIYQHLRSVPLPFRHGPSHWTPFFITRLHSTAATPSSHQEPEPSCTTHTHPQNDSISLPATGLSTSPHPTPFYFSAGYAIHAKRKTSRPFPPPFLSRPSGSFSDPLSTHDSARDRRPTVNGELIRGITNGDDAVLLGDRFICAGDGVGAWSTKEKGNAALWSRLIVHFWAHEAEKSGYGDGEGQENGARMVADLQRAYELTIKATQTPTEWFGTTTASGALIADDGKEDPRPVLYITQLGDSTIMVVRPRDREILYKTKEQWHWFDCPRQLGTNSPDTPEVNAVMDRLEVEEDDVVLAMTDGVGDNLWDHEIMQNVVDSMHRWQNGEAVQDDDLKGGVPSDKMMYVARELVKSARVIAEDPFAESPYMEKAIDEGLSIEGGKRDDISVVAAQCKRRKT